VTADVRAVASIPFQRTVAKRYSFGHRWYLEEGAELYNLAGNDVVTDIESAHVAKTGAVGRTGTPTSTPTNAPPRPLLPDGVTAFGRNSGVRGSVLIVSGDETGSSRLAKGLRRKGFHATRAGTAALAVRALSRVECDVVLMDLDLVDADGLALCERVVANHPDVPVVAVARAGTLESAVGSIRAGAYDYLARPLRIDVVTIAIGRAIQHRSLKREVRRLREAVYEASHFGDLLGSSAPMRDLYDLLNQVAHSDVTVMIAGETGTGKELAARAIHKLSRRRMGTFVAVNCAAVPEALIETELFGHVKGAFTDARSARVGLFIQANGGTIFLDEIGDLPLALQPKLLRALQDRVVRPVGSGEEIPFDARVISASNVDLDIAVAEKRFRSDLYFRLNVVQVDVPPLRSRGSDILLLAQHFVDMASARSGKDITALSLPVARKLMDYPWPGNVRELENCVERAVALTRSGEITIDDLPPRVRHHRVTAVPAAVDPTQLEPMHVIEERYIRRVLASVGNNKTRAARLLGFDRKTLYRKLARYKIGVVDAPA
jgi:DNA-binding NtrC family response regulator